MDTPALRKARGAFFTPPEISEYIARWAVRSASDEVLEPSCGEASFLLAAGQSLRARGASAEGVGRQLFGVEIHAESADAARGMLAAENLQASIAIGDFFETSPDRCFDALIGNPPYVRYQNHSGVARARSLEGALAQGVRLNGLASSWAAFVVHAASFLKPGGRLGLVLPAELLTVSYASEVRKFLLRRFAKVRLVMFETLVFPGVLEEVVLLLAEGDGGAGCFEVFQARDLSALPSISGEGWAAHKPISGEKWTPALLTPSLVSDYGALLAEDGFEVLRDWGQTYLGAVSGANPYFAMTRSDAAARGLGPKDVVAISPPGSRHLRGLNFSTQAWATLQQDEAKCLLFYPDGPPSPAAQAYIAEGEQREIPKAYKCTVRTPWWRVPLVARPDLLLTYMNHDTPKLVTNEANLHILNSVYGVGLHSARRALGRELLPLACLNSVTLLGAEVVGRAYGGGLLKLEPREADLLPIPSQQLLKASRDQLLSIRPQLASALRGGKLSEAVALVDDVLLSGQLGMSHASLQAVREGRDLLFQRRVSRGKGSRVQH